MAWGIFFAGLSLFGMCVLLVAETQAPDEPAAPMESGSPDAAWNLNDGAAWKEAA